MKYRPPCEDLPGASSRRCRAQNQPLWRWTARQRSGYTPASVSLPYRACSRTPAPTHNRDRRNSIRLPALPLVQARARLFMLPPVTGDEGLLLEVVKP